jgi:hypothetical protein
LLLLGAGRWSVSVAPTTLYTVYVFNKLYVIYTLNMLCIAPQSGSCVIYDLHTISEVRSMPRRKETVADVEALLAAGEMLSLGQIALLVGMSRYAVDHWLNDGIRVPGRLERWMPEYELTPGGHRLVPADAVRRIVEMRRMRRQGPTERAMAGRGEHPGAMGVGDPASDPRPSKCTSNPAPDQGL